MQGFSTLAARQEAQECRDVASPSSGTGDHVFHDRRGVRLCRQPREADSPSCVITNVRTPSQLLEIETLFGNPGIS